MPKDSKESKAKSKTSTPIKQGEVVKIRRTPTQASINPASSDIPVKELEARRKQLQDQLLQVEMQV